MTTPEALHIGISIDAPFDRAYTFAAQPENFPKWAAGLSQSLHRVAGDWIARTPLGDAVVRFSEPNSFGVLDHRVTIEGQPEIYIPLRMIDSGTGTEVVLTLFRQPSMDDDAFTHDANLVRADLRALKELLEG
jgi:hypothetical protein